MRYVDSRGRKWIFRVKLPEIQKRVFWRFLQAIHNIGSSDKLCVSYWEEEEEENEDFCSMLESSVLGSLLNFGFVDIERVEQPGPVKEEEL